MRRRERHLSEDETKDWQALAKSVKPIKRRTALVPPADAPVAVAPLKPAAKLKRAEEGRRVVLPKPAPAVAPKLPEPDLANMDRRNAERLRRGEMVIDGHLDLHGMTEERAHGALASFISRSAAMGHRCVIVVTGKGNVSSRDRHDAPFMGERRGILRAAVPRWLKEPGLRAQVVAFTTARPQHGGTGALYVLLRRRRETTGLKRK